MANGLIEVLRRNKTRLETDCTFHPTYFLKKGFTSNVFLLPPRPASFIPIRCLWSVQAPLGRMYLRMRRRSEFLRVCHFRRSFYRWAAEWRRTGACGTGMTWPYGRPTRCTCYCCCWWCQPSLWAPRTRPSAARCGAWWNADKRWPRARGEFFLPLCIVCVIFKPYSPFYITLLYHIGSTNIIIY